MFTLSVQKEALISEIVERQNQRSWNLQCRRSLYIWDEEQLNNLKQILSTIQMDDT
ncbi:hypothetical protein RHGRI_001463 [Rhododendron griersonianum]|uniref:Uncharacterized protein n=1 Tax=Rhododendron griersonianum TaxID=479676 RepID=A0AAV6LLH2_9ERIC|nr:hypothetical protein RHGRI_001463 [Rhododendron griersonianum]